MQLNGVAKYLLSVWFANLGSTKFHSLLQRLFPSCFLHPCTLEASLCQTVWLHYCCNMSKLAGPLLNNSLHQFRLNYFTNKGKASELIYGKNSDYSVVPFTYDLLKVDLVDLHMVFWQKKFPFFLSLFICCWQRPLQRRVTKFFRISQRSVYWTTSTIATKSFACFRNHLPREFLWRFCMHWLNKAHLQAAKRNSLSWKLDKCFVTVSWYSTDFLNYSGDFADCKASMIRVLLAHCLFYMSLVYKV